MGTNSMRIHGPDGDELDAGNAVDAGGSIPEDCEEGVTGIVTGIQRTGISIAGGAIPEDCDGRLLAGSASAIRSMSVPAYPACE